MKRGLDWRDWVLVTPDVPKPNPNFLHRYSCHIKNSHKVSNLLLASRAIRHEAEAVLYQRFRFFFSAVHDPLYVLYLTRSLRQDLRNQISHLALLIRVILELCMSKTDLYNGQYYYMRNIWEWKESNEMLALALPNLKSVVFELQILARNSVHLAPLPDPLPAAPTTYYAPVSEKCAAVARPFHDYRAHSPGLVIRFVAERQTLGELLAGVCEEREVNVGRAWEEWPWTKTDEYLRKRSLKYINRSLVFSKHFPEIDAMRRKWLDKAGEGSTGGPGSGGRSQRLPRGG